MTQWAWIEMCQCGHHEYSKEQFERGWNDMKPRYRGEHDTICLDCHEDVRRGWIPKGYLPLRDDTYL